MYTLPITVTVAIRNGGLELLPHWLRYYAAQCSPCHLCLTIIGGLDRQSVVHQIASGCVLSPYTSFSIHPVADGTVDGHEEQMASLSQLGLITGRDWVVWTDLDEFHSTGVQSLRQAIEEADGNGLKAIFGHLVDRHTVDGSLAAVVPDKPIFDQFPVQSKFSQQILGAWGLKVIAAKWKLPVTQGHHGIRVHPDHGPYGETQHFKWSSTVQERLDEWRRKGEWHPQWNMECERLNAHLKENGGKIILP